MPVLGGDGTLYGAFVGAAVYLVARDVLSALDPVYWYFWLGLIIVMAVLFANDGLVGLLRRLQAWAARRWATALPIRCFSPKAYAKTSARYASRTISTCSSPPGRTTP